ncbi:hypothetical protein RYX36_013343 [Vicia faba]
MEIRYGKLFSPILILLLLASFVVIFIALPSNLTRFIVNLKPTFSISLQNLRTKVSGEDDILLAVEHAGDHSNSTLKSEVRKVIKSKEEKREEELARARDSMRKAALGDRRRNLTPSSTSRDGDYFSAEAVYHNPRLFYQSYLEMEKIFKVYVYPDGDLPIVHDGPCKDIYAIEGRFLHEIEYGVGKLRTNDPNAAHVYFLPFSVTWMVKYFYTQPSYDLTPLKQFVSDYVNVISMRHPFWNRTHDVSLPEIYLYGGEVSPKLLTPPPDTAPRRYLAFFSGGLHGPIRPILLEHWKNKDSDIAVYEYLTKGMDYYSFMLNSKYCLCPSGHEVASPRIVESIYAECVPVILSNFYVLPFSDVLRWEAFSVQVDVSDIPRLKEILSGIPESKYRKLKNGVRAVRKHFTLNQPAKRFDVFHMILHSIWLRRLNLKFG